MNKKRIVLTMSVGLLALSAFGGTAFAHWGPGNAEATYEKIAEELGTEQQTVADAFATAGDEARDAAIAEKLAKLVEVGAITQEEADEIQAWYDTAPDSIDKMKRGGHHVDLERVAELLDVDIETLSSVAGQARSEVAVEAYSARLDEAVADGRITEEEAAEMLARFENRPQREFGERGDKHGRRHHHRGGHGRGMGEMRGERPEGQGFGGFRLAPEGDDAPTFVDPTGFAA